MRFTLLCAFGALALGVATPAGAADDLDLDLDAPVAKPAAKKKGAKSSKASKKPAAADLDLDLDAPAGKPAASDLDLDLDAPVAKPAGKASGKPAAKPSLDLDLDLDDAPAKAPAGLDLDIGLDDAPVTKPGTKPETKKTAPTPSPARNVPPPKKTTPAPTPSPVAPPEEEDDESGMLDAVGPFHPIELGLKLGGLVFAGRPNDAVIAASAGPAAGRGLTVPTMVEARWRPSARLADLAILFEAGFFPKSGAVSRELPHDPDFQSTTSAWSIVAVPLALGVSWDLPLRLNFDSIGFAVRAAFLGQYVRSTTTWTTGSVSVANAAQTGFALGWLAGAEATFLVGPGAVVVDVRYAQAFTDLGLPAAYAAQGVQAEQPYNRAAPGDVQGTNVLVGYRLLL